MPVTVTDTFFGAGVPLFQLSVPNIDPTAASQLIRADPLRFTDIVLEPALPLQDADPVTLSPIDPGTLVTLGWKPALKPPREVQTPT
ncbi:MAG: hypothetical protein ACR2MY_08910 [Candidatus Dormibacteria bacterium]